MGPLDPQGNRCYIKNRVNPGLSIYLFMSSYPESWIEQKSFNHLAEEFIPIRSFHKRNGKVEDTDEEFGREMVRRGPFQEIGHKVEGIDLYQLE